MIINNYINIIVNIPSVKISVIIPTHNSRDKLIRCLNSISGNNAEIIVVDDAGTDGTKKAIEDYEHVKYLRNLRRKGPAFCRNCGARIAKGNILAFVDDDCILSPGWINKIVREHEKFPEVAGIGGMTACLSDDKISTYFTKIAQYTICKNLASLDTEKTCTFLPSCNISYKRKVFDKLMFDECFTEASGEDIDFNLRLNETGNRVIYDDSILLFHEAPDSLMALFKKMYKYGKYVPLLKRKHPKIPLVVPNSFYGVIQFSVAPFLSIGKKLVHTKSIYSFVDELGYRLGILAGMKIQNTYSTTFKLRHRFI